MNIPKNKIPCSQCIVLPICRKKVIVSCNLLSDAADLIDEDTITVKAWWILVNNYLPEAITILPDGGLF